MIKTLICSAAILMQASAEENPADARIYELRSYHAAPGKLEALRARFRDHTVKLFEKHGMTNVGYWVPTENPESLLVYLMAYPDRESRDASWKEFANDADWRNAQAESEVEGKPVEKVDQIFMKPTDFSHGFPALGGEGHIFEMRTYTATKGHLPNLHSRFRDHTIALFKKHGITSLGYFQFVPDQAGAENTLLYFLAHKDAASAEKSWEDFRVDPDWIAAKKASEENAGGSLTKEDGVISVFLKPADFSPVK